MNVVIIQATINVVVILEEIMGFLDSLKNLFGGKKEEAPGMEAPTPAPEMPEAPVAEEPVVEAAPEAEAPAEEPLA